mmetsp:Transcript_12804/g.40616  ORF Transcript_12804/g.40616 Transcript_12804/m.40616 type:complete len:211 (+) Transcript_12804:1297-1929(+)
MLASTRSFSSSSGTPGKAPTISRPGMAQFDSSVGPQYSARFRAITSNGSSGGSPASRVGAFWSTRGDASKVTASRSMPATGGASGRGVGTHASSPEASEISRFARRGVSPSSRRLSISLPLSRRPRERPELARRRLVSCAAGVFFLPRFAGREKREGSGGGRVPCSRALPALGGRRPPPRPLAASLPRLTLEVLRLDGWCGASKRSFCAF